MATKEIVPLDSYAVLREPETALELVRETLDGSEITEFDLARVRMPAGGGTSWEVPTLAGTEPRKVIEGVVLFYKSARSYWEGEYSGGNEPPDCSSPDAVHATAREGVKIPAPVDETGMLLCDGCAYSDWGTAKGGSGRGQACKLTRQLFMLTPERRLPLVISLPPTSLRQASKFFLSLADYGKDYRTIVIEVGLEKVSGQNVPDYSRATFVTAPGGELSEPQAKVATEYATLLRPFFDRVRVTSGAEIGQE